MNIIVKIVIMTLNVSYLAQKDRVARHATAKVWPNRYQPAALSVRLPAEKPYLLPPLHQGAADVLQRAARAVVALNEQIRP